MGTRPFVILLMLPLGACAEGEDLGSLGLGNHVGGASMTATSPTSGGPAGGDPSTPSRDDAGSAGGAFLDQGGKGGTGPGGSAGAGGAGGSAGSPAFDAGSKDAMREAMGSIEAGSLPKGIALLYKCTDTNPNDSQVAPSYKIVNTGGPTVDLADFKIRYFLSDEGKAKLLSDFLYAEVNGGAGYRDIRNLVEVRITPAVVAVAGADTVVEVGFTAAAGTLTDGQTSTINFVVHTEGFALSLSESDDYSHDLTRTDFGPNDKVTLYAKDVLVAGTAP